MASGVLALSLGNRQSGPGPQSVDYESGGVTFNTNGTASISGSGATALPQSNWFLPTTTSIGSSYWLTVNQTGSTGGCNFAGIVNNTPTALSSAIALSAAGGAGTCRGSYTLSTSSSGSPVVQRGIVSCNNTI